MIFFEYVDSDALDRLYAHHGSDWRLTARVATHEVRVDGEGTIDVDGYTYRYDGRTVTPDESSADR